MRHCFKADKPAKILTKKVLMHCWFFYLLLNYLIHYLFILLFITKWYLISSLRISYTMFLPYWLSLSQLFPDLPHTSLPIQPQVFLRKKKKPHQFQFVLLNTLGCGVISWSMINLPGATPFKKTESPTPRSYPLPITPQLGIGLWDHLPSSCSGFVWLWSICTVTLLCPENTLSL